MAWVQSHSTNIMPSSPLMPTTLLCHESIQLVTSAPTSSLSGACLWSWISSVLQPRDWTSYQHGFVIWVPQSSTNHWRISNLLQLLPQCHVSRSKLPSVLCIRLLLQAAIPTFDQYPSPRSIDREFEFYEFFSFLKFNEFYEFFFRLKKIWKKFVILQIIDV